MTNTTDAPNEALDGLSSDQLERKLDDTRASISEKMQILQDELEPQKLMNTGIEYVREKVDFEDTMDFVTSNPLPVVLTVTGLVWLAVAYQDRSSGTGSTDSETWSGGYADLNDPDPYSSEPVSAFQPETRSMDQRDAVRPSPEVTPTARRLPTPDYERYSESTSEATGQPAAVVLAGLGLGLLAGLYLS